MTTSEISGNTQSLAQRISQGRIPAPEALRYAMILADALRKVHDAGQVHGAVSPGCIAITRTGLELLPSAGSVASATPYTAPEILLGRPADSRSDIFSFGTILYEMLTGRVAFAGEGPVLTAAITSALPPPSGSPAVDRLVGSCVAKDPGARWQRMQKLLLELKLLAVAVQRAESPGIARRDPPDPTPAIRAEMQQIESRLTARLDSCEATVRESAASLSRLEQSIADRISQLERTASEAVSRMEKAGDERLARVDAGLTGVQQDAAALRESVSDDLSMFDKTLRSQAAAIESARTAMGQTDDLVERVVEALESLQSVVLDHADSRPMVTN